MVSSAVAVRLLYGVEFVYARTKDIVDDIMLPNYFRLGAEGHITDMYDFQNY